ncbi:MAG TPA: Rv2175c family DNA-binding protein [Dermatophilaceae bacterium]|nr:Rv2175c family DNA-binding protein [Dermatophilaceae bacterium]
MANDSIPDAPADDGLDNDDLEALVGEWLTVPDIGERMGLRLSDVRQMIEDRQVLAVRIGPRNVVSVPSKFFNDEGPLPELPGTFTVLGDSRMTDAQILRWLFTPDDTLPVQGAPMDALLAGFKTEVRRRAMEAAY